MKLNKMCCPIDGSELERFLEPLEIECQYRCEKLGHVYTDNPIKNFELTQKYLTEPLNFGAENNALLNKYAKKVIDEILE